MYVLGAQKTCLIKMVHLSAHNICCDSEIRYLILNYTLLSKASVHSSPDGYTDNVKSVNPLKQFEGWGGDMVRETNLRDGPCLSRALSVWPIPYVSYLSKAGGTQIFKGQLLKKNNMDFF